MNNIEYINNKILAAYELYKNNKFTKKVRGIIIHNNKLLVIKMEYNNGKIHYLLPGGTVDKGETIKDAVIRETLEEYNINIKPIKYLGKLYYKMDMNLNNEEFQSRVIDYYYICEYISTNTESTFGIDGEFSKNDRKYIKTALTIDELKSINHYDLNDMDKKNFDKLIQYMENV